LPAIPSSAKAPPIANTAFMGAPGPDPTAATQIAAQVQEADKAEQEASGSGGAAVASAPIAPPPPPPVATKEPKIGMTVAEIEAMFGNPSLKFNGAGNKTTYSYKDVGIKIIFTDGKVTAIN
jgi:hypothetical protein